MHCFLVYIMACLQKQVRLKKSSVLLEQTSESSVGPCLLYGKALWGRVFSFSNTQPFNFWSSVTAEQLSSDAPFQGSLESE